MTNRIKSERFFTKIHNSDAALKLNIEQSGSLIFLDCSNNSLEIDLPPVNIITSLSLNFLFLITNITNLNTIKINSKDKQGNLENKIKVKSDDTFGDFSTYTIITDTSVRNWIGDNFKMISDGNYWYLTDNTWNETTYSLSIGSGNTDNNIITAQGNNFSLKGNNNLTFDGSKLTINASIETSDSITNSYGVVSFNDSAVISNNNIFSSNLETSKFYSNNFMKYNTLLKDINFFGYKLDTNSNGKIVIVFYYNNSSLFNSIPTVETFSLINNKYTKIGSLLTGSTSDQFGSSIAINGQGDIIGIGATQSVESFQGIILGNGYFKTYKFLNNNWVQLGDTILGTDNEGLGFSSKFNFKGDILVICNLNERVKIYNFNGTEWTQKGITITNTLDFGYGFGSVLDLSSNANILVIGSPSASSSNIVYSNGNFRTFVYNDDTNNYDEVGSPVFGATSLERSASALSLNGNGKILAVGSPGYDDNRGTVKIYSFDGSVWSQIGSQIDGNNKDREITITDDITNPSINMLGDTLGDNISLSNDGKILAIGVPNGQSDFIYSDSFYKSSKGYIKIYYWDTQNYILQNTLLGDFIEHNGIQLIDVFTGLYPGIGISIKVSADGNIVTCASEFTRIGSETEYFSGDNNCTSIVNFTNDLFKPNVGNILKSIYNESVNIIFKNSESGFNEANVGVTLRVDNLDNFTVFGETYNDLFGTSFKFSNDGSKFVVGAPGNDENGASAGCVKVYNYVDGGGGNFIYTQIGNTINGEATGDKSGHSVSINNDGTIIAIGAPYNGSGAGHVRVFQYNGVDTWVQLGSDIDGDAGDNSGWAVCLNNSGTILATGSPNYDNSKGRVSVYQYDAGTTTWSQLGNDIVGSNNGDKCGTSLDFNNDGTIIAVGSPYASDGAVNNDGITRVFQYFAPNWTQMGGGDLSHSTIISNSFTGETFTDEQDGKLGWSVALNNSGTKLAVGKPYYKELENTVGITMNGDGVVIIFEYIDNIWTFKSEITAPLNFLGDGVERGGSNFGFSVDFNNDGTLLIVGNPNIDRNNAIDTSLNTNLVWDQKGDDIDGEAASDNSGNSISLSSDGTIVAIGATGNDDNGNLSGHVRVYEYSEGGGGGIGGEIEGGGGGGGGEIEGSWEQIGQDIDGESAGDESGISVSLSSNGTIIAIGAIGNDGNGNSSGHVRVYQYNGVDTWTQLGQDIDGEAADDESGHSVSLSSNGTIVAIGATGNDGNGNISGHVRVYEYNGVDTWTQLGSDIDGESAGDLLGQSVSLSSDGSIVAIGATENDGVNGNASGHVRVYQYNGSGNPWLQLGSDIDGEAAGDESGISVSLNSKGSIVAIGASGNDGVNGETSGHVRVYQYNGVDTWTQLGQDIDGEVENDELGHSVSLSSDGTIVAIGAIGVDSGHVRVYQYNGVDTWVQLGTDIDGEAAGDQSGYSVSLSSDGKTVAIGAVGNDGNGVAAGHVRIYNYTQAGDGGGGGLGEIEGPIFFYDSVFVYYFDSELDTYQLFENQPDDNPGIMLYRSVGYSVAISNENNVIGMGSPIRSYDATSNAGGVAVIQGTIINNSAPIPVLDFSNVGDKYIEIQELSGAELTLSFINANNVGQTGYIHIYIGINIDDGGAIGFGSISFDSGFVVNGNNDWLAGKYSFYKYFIVEEGVVILTRFETQNLTAV